MRIPPFVIDASLVIAVVRGEPDGLSAAQALDHWTRERRRLIVPGHFWLEVANALGSRRRLPGSAILEAIHEIDGFGLETIDGDRAQLILTIDLMERHGLTAYDAAYLGLAITWDGLVATFDSALRVAAADRLVHVGRPRLAETPASYEHTVTWPNYKGASAFLAKLRAEAARPG
jgi:predicted nucleic acid-binding protein